MTYKKKKRRKIILLAIIIPLALIITGACICTALVLTDSIQSEYTLKEETNTFYIDLLKGAVLGKEFDLSENEVNTFLNKKYCTSQGDGLYNVMVDLNKDEPSKVFAKVRIHGTDIAVRADLTVYSDGQHQIVTELHNAYAGELKIPDLILAHILRKVFSSSDRISADGTRLTIKAEYTYEFTSTSISLYLTEISADDGILHCRTNSLTAEALHAAIDYLTSEEGQEAVSSLINGVKDKLKDLFF